MTMYFACINMQLKDLETSQDSRKLFASGRDIGTVPISKEEKAALQSGIQEQEVLLQGYQKVNPFNLACSDIRRLTLLI